VLHLSLAPSHTIGALAIALSLSPAG